MRLADPPARQAEDLLKEVEQRIAGYGRDRAVVAFSGGVDSSVVLASAVRVLGPARVAAVTASSPSYPAGELEAARSLAAEIGAGHTVIETGEVGREAYTRNDTTRCFHCKVELYGTIDRLVRTESPGSAVVLAGANADDATDFRPGLMAGERQGIRNPLLELGIGKAGVRAIARQLALSVADKPALACLSSRVEFGIRITPDLLARIDRAEGAVRALGFDQVRVRHLVDEEASIEVDPGQVHRLVAHPRLGELESKLRSMGWRRVRVDLAGYRAGSLNPEQATGAS